MDKFSVYILHFDSPYWSNCQHYVGYTKDLKARLKQHENGNGSKLVKYANRLGIKWTSVRVEEFDFQFDARRREV